MNLNEAKWAFLNAAVAKPGKINELEHMWLDAQLATGDTLDEKWYSLFGQTDMSWNEAAHAWLDLQGIPDKRTLDERFYLYYTTPGIIIGGTVTLTAGDNGGARVGFQDGVYGALNPDETSDGYQISALFCNNNNGRVRFKVEGEYQQNRFTSMEIVGVGTLLTADAIYDYDGSETEWRWDGTGFNLVSGTVYAVAFV